MTRLNPIYLLSNRREQCCARTKLIRNRMRYCFYSVFLAQPSFCDFLFYKFYPTHIYLSISTSITMMMLFSMLMDIDMHIVHRELGAIAQNITDRRTAPAFLLTIQPVMECFLSRPATFTNISPNYANISSFYATCLSTYDTQFVCIQTVWPDRQN